MSALSSCATRRKAQRAADPGYSLHRSLAENLAAENATLDKEALPDLDGVGG
jgi:hypothetical protein